MCVEGVSSLTAVSGRSERCWRISVASAQVPSNSMACCTAIPSTTDDDDDDEEEEEEDAELLLLVVVLSEEDSVELLIPLSVEEALLCLVNSSSATPHQSLHQLH